VECDKVRAEFPHIKIESCCESCHEDEDLGYGEDLWFNLNGEYDKEYNVCCAVANSFKKHHAKD